MSYRYSPETIMEKRKFPKGYTVLLVILIIVQLLLILGGIFYKASPKDRIDSYEVYVTPLSDGTLDIKYKIKWTALDTSEPLTWIDIGMANPNFAIYGGYTKNIDRIIEHIDIDGYCSARIYLKDSYIGGESLYFEFEINQSNMLYESNGAYAYEFVPSWFNEIPVTSYAFYWLDSDNVTGANADSFNGVWHKWEGSLEPGDYRLMKVNYSEFNAPTVYYREFDDRGAFNALAEDKYGVWALIGIFLVITILAEIFIIDAFVSYNRGRGFLTGYGHSVHTYGYRNPRYIAAHRANTSSHHSGRGGRGGGGGCACACACACAGGGRAGCSQKDTTEVKKDSDEAKKEE